MKSLHRVSTKIILALTCAALVLPVPARSQQGVRVKAGWSELPALLKRIVPPKFPKKDFDITQFGAVGDSKTDCTGAFAAAIRKCSSAGGGRVVVPAGVYLTGAIHLKNNVNLYV